MTDKKEKPLTLDQLAKYNQEVFFPYMEERFATKKELTEFKSESFNKQDEILAKLTALSQEKTVGDEQDKRQKKVLGIHNNALKNKGILSKDQSLEIDKLRVF